MMIFHKVPPFLRKQLPIWPCIKVAYFLSEIKIARRTAEIKYLPIVYRGLDYDPPITNDGKI